MIIRYMRDKNRRPWGCIVLIDADHIGWTICNPADRWNKKLARDGGIVYGRNRNGPYIKYVMTGAKERAGYCNLYDLAAIDCIPTLHYPPGRSRLREIQTEVFFMRKWAQAREAGK